MNRHCVPTEASSRVRDLLSLREVVVLANVPEGRVRKDIETGVLSKPHVIRLADARLCFGWFHVFMVAAVYSNETLTGKLRKIAIHRIGDECLPVWSEPCRHDCNPVYDLDANGRVELDRFVSLDLSKVLHHIRPRVGVYASGLRRIEEKADILGGEAVFKGSRLSVLHIGKMVESGEKAENILEDYPNLNDDDIRFAALYYKAHPSIGRPRSGGEKHHGGSCTG